MAIGSFVDRQNLTVVTGGRSGNIGDEPVGMIEEPVADHIRASGQSCRTNRPDT
jgi:hypothetical protein